MRIQQLVLENFRGFEKLEMDFPEGEGGLVVLVGVNGSGKTSVLDALKTNLFGALSQLNTFNIINKKPPLFKLDIRNISELRLLDIKNYPNTENSLWIKTLFKSKSTQILYRSELVKSHERISNIKNGSFPTSEKDITPFNEEISKNNYPTIAFYPINRNLIKNVNWYDPKGEIRPDIKFRDNDYTDSFNASIDFELFLHWFKYREEVENEMRVNENSEYRDDQLKWVRKAFKSFETGINEPRIKRVPNIRLTFQKNDKEVSLMQLSDGEKAMFTLVGDIARRLIVRNTIDKNPKIYVNTPLHGHGIVLIDEIELHLHPAWQRKIIPALRRTFPNVQFIVTTHSPQVISTVPKENVFILEDFKLVEKTPFTKGRDSNNLLYNIFGVEERPKIAKEDFQKLYDFLDEENIEKVRANIKEMEAKYGEDDPDIIEAKGHIKDFFELD